MPRMTDRKRPREQHDGRRPEKRTKRVKKQLQYHSSSDDESEDAAEMSVAEAGSGAVREPEAPLVEDEGHEDSSMDGGEDSEASQSEDAASGSDSSNADARRRKRKRDDPDAFATSMTKILSSKLTAAKRADPVLSRSRAATETQQSRSDAKLEERARRKLREDKKKLSDQGRIRDVLAGEEEGLTAHQVAEREKRLRKTAQRGVVKLFNAFAAAHRKGEEAARDTRRDGVVGVDNREERVQSMSKEAFLDLIASGGKKVTA